jgi:hypothetical protein
MIISQSSSTLLIGRYAKAAHVLHVSRTCFFLSFFLSFFVFHQKTDIFSCLHRHWLKWKLQPVLTESGETIYCTDDRWFRIVLHNVNDQKEHQIFSRVNKQWYGVSFLSGRSANSAGFTYSPYSVLLRPPYKLHNWESCLGQFSTVHH